MSFARGVTVPGWRGSGPAHWQTIWGQSHPEYVCVARGGCGPHQCPFRSRPVAGWGRPFPAIQKPGMLACLHGREIIIRSKWRNQSC